MKSKKIYTRPELNVLSVNFEGMVCASPTSNINGTTFNSGGAASTTYTSGDGKENGSSVWDEE